MKFYFWQKIFIFLVSGFFLFSTPLYLYSQLSGAWEVVETSDSGLVVQMLLLSDDCFTLAAYKPMNGQFISTKGGKWSSKDSKIMFNVEFNTSDSSLVSKNEIASFAISDGKLQLNQKTWTKVNSIQDTNLSGQFLFSGRKQQNEMVRRDVDQPRKTMKILIGNRFQWIAYNTENGEFFGTGGGTYTARDGTYTEQIEFFSKNINRVGMSLSFGYQIIDNEWHHTGKNSSGEEMYEIWTRRQ